MKSCNNLENNLDSFKHILKSSTSMYDSSDSRFLRTTTEIQSGPDVFDKSSSWGSSPELQKYYAV